MEKIPNSGEPFLFFEENKHLILNIENLKKENKHPVIYFIHKKMSDVYKYIPTIKLENKKQNFCHGN